MAETLAEDLDRAQARLRRRGRRLDVAPVPRVALTREEAAAAVGMSLNSFERHVQPDLRMVRRGKLRLVPVHELERWADEHAESTLPG